MLASLSMVVSLALAMAISSFLAGSMPLSFALSARKLRFISAVGSGVLVGSSLTVIIPEGIEVLYGARHGHNEGASSSSKLKPHAWVGLSLVSGFILMYLIDQLPQHIRNHPGTYSQPLHVSLSDLTNDLHRDRAATSSHSDADSTSAFEYAPKEARKSSTSIGLVIHAAADGIALGASTSASTTDLGLVVFVAIMVHKVPAAFGLTSVLLKEGLTKRAARTHLVIFSLAAPAGALATWAVVNLLGPSWVSGLDGINLSTGVLLLFSGGTFLYVAMHAMQQPPCNVASPAVNLRDTRSSDPYIDTLRKTSDVSMTEAALTVLGMLLPLLTQVGHAH